jgi:plasmid stabilization system protein ParE
LTYRIRVSKRAATQIRTAADWWLANRTKAPQAFAEELERAFELIRTFPSVGESVPHARIVGIRRVLMARVRYHLYYGVQEETELVEVIALWHASRGASPRL